MLQQNIQNTEEHINKEDAILNEECIAGFQYNNPDMPAGNLNNLDHDLELDSINGSFDVNPLLVHDDTLSWVDMPTQNKASERNNVCDGGQLSNIKMTSYGVKFVLELLTVN
ncbi:unnamed protein product [Cuscuta epithymum]|uniref:Uncharacterized protein n=1 Tax=Cuscuta epithymum TaxID=186058 RepID=A0AAV0D7B5_9ASTE|nr:unnamed protein product [Cuscuta epithymum]